MISRSDLAAMRAGYTELLLSEVASVAQVQRPDKTKDSTGAANTSAWVAMVSNVPAVVEELTVRQTEALKLRHDAEVKESAYVLIMGHDVDVRPGDRIVITGDTTPYQVLSVPTHRTLDIVTEAICIQSHPLSDRL